MLQQMRGYIFYIVCDNGERIDLRYSECTDAFLQCSLISRPSLPQVQSLPGSMCAFMHWYIGVSAVGLSGLSI